jgi:hypothetical protein
LNITKGKRNRFEEKQRNKRGSDGKIDVHGGKRLEYLKFFVLLML